MIKKIFSHVLILAWMIFIFCMSAQPGETSGEMSGGVSYLFMQVYSAIFGLNWSEAEILQMAEIWGYPIRKLAHMTEFGILAMLIYWGLGCYERFTDRRHRTAFLGAVIYAATDEFHQLFVPDRSGNLFDVVVDATGAIIALVFVWLFSHGIQQISRMRTKK